MKNNYLLLSLLLCCLIISCKQQTPEQDIHKFIAEVKKQTLSMPAPIPSAIDEKPKPINPSANKASFKQEANKTINHLILVGTLIDSKQRWAFIKSQNTAIKQLEIGNITILEHYQLTKITETEIEFTNLKTQKKIILSLKESL